MFLPKLYLAKQYAKIFKNCFLVATGGPDVCINAFS